MKRNGRAVAALTSVAAALFALYALEAVLGLANPRWVDKLGTTLRRGPSVIGETYRLRSEGAHAYPFLQTDTFVDSANTNGTLPLSGPASSQVVLCNEMGNSITYVSDSLGFRNPPDVWEPIHSPLAIVGDSFAHGFCRPEEETIAGVVRSRGQRVVNVGLTGAGPLAELGAIREYLSRVRPARVYWLFYEGNDLIDIVSERTTILSQYLDPAFSQRSFDRRAELDSLIKRKGDSLLSSYRPPGFLERAKSFLILRKLRTATGLFRRPPLSDRSDESAELRIVESVLNRASSDVRGWGGKLTIVYLPERRRYNEWTAPVVGENHDPRVVEARVNEIAVRLGIPVINMATIFASQRDPQSLWNARRYHYNERGYALIANAILDDLKSP